MYKSRVTIEPYPVNDLTRHHNEGAMLIASRPECCWSELHRPSQTIRESAQVAISFFSTGKQT
jgi:hypothetical protein